MYRESERYIHICIHVCMYVYIYRERERFYIMCYVVLRVAHSTSLVGNTRSSTCSASSLSAQDLRHASKSLSTA